MTKTYLNQILSVIMIKKNYITKKLPTTYGSYLFFIVMSVKTVDNHKLFAIFGDFDKKIARTKSSCNNGLLKVLFVDKGN